MELGNPKNFITKKRKYVNLIKSIAFFAIPTFTLACVFKYASIGTYSMYMSEAKTKFSITTLDSSQLIDVSDEKMLYGANCHVKGSFKVKNLSNDDIPLTIKDKTVTLGKYEEETFSFVINEKGHCSNYTVKLPVVGYNNFVTEYAIFNIDKDNLIKPNSSSQKENSRGVEFEQKPSTLNDVDNKIDKVSASKTDASKNKDDARITQDENSKEFQIDNSVTPSSKTESEEMNSNDSKLNEPKANISKNKSESTSVIETN